MLEKWLLSVGAVSLSFAWGAGFMWAQGGFSPAQDTTVVAQPTGPDLPSMPAGYGNPTPVPSASPAPIRLEPKTSATPAPRVAQPGAVTPLTSAGELAATSAPVDAADPVTPATSAPSPTSPTPAGASGSGTEF